MFDTVLASIQVSSEMAVRIKNRNVSHDGVPIASAKVQLPWPGMDSWVFCEIHWPENMIQ